MNKFIIIEGPDNTGKTTLAKFLANQRVKEGKRAIYFHFNRFGELGRAMHDYQLSVHANLAWCMEYLDTSIILDRSWPSEVIYGSVIGPRERMNKFCAQRIQDEFGEIEPIYVHACAISGLARHLQDQAHDHVNYSMVEYQNLCRAYSELFNNMRKSPSANVVNYDMDVQGANLSKVYDQLFNHAELS